MRLLNYFWKNLRRISSINGFYNVINWNKNIKSCEFYVKILHRECREVAKRGMVLVKYCLPVIWKKYVLIKNFDITKSFSARQHHPSWLPKIVQICISLQWPCFMSDEAVYCTESAMFLSSEKQRSFGSFVSKESKDCHNIPRNPKIKYRKSM